VPALGCGYGGLDWNEVRPMIIEALRETAARIELYPPESSTRASSGSEEVDDRTMSLLTLDTTD
jgi:hypothetical protein